MIVSAWLTGIAFGLSVIFPVLYLVRTPPRNSPGRAVLTFSIIVSFVLGLAFARSLGIMLPEWVRPVIYGGIIVGLFLMDFTLIKEQSKPPIRVDGPDSLR